MNIKIIVILSVTLVIILLISDFAFSYQSMPPPGHTGAPPEGTCFTTSCHTTRPPVNGGNGGLEIYFQEGLTKYLPDSVYTIKVKLKDISSYYFGFQMTAINKDETMTGSFELMDTSRTHIMSSFNRDYISHYNAYDSINIRKDSSLWEFKWKAPSSDVGPVTFYAAGVAGDQATSFPFGYVYQTSLEIEAGNVSVEDKQEFAKHIKLYPSPAKAHLHVELPKAVTEVQIKVFNGTGQLVKYSEPDRDKSAFVMDISELNAGIYFISIKTKDHYGTKRVIKVEN